ncbi:MAG: hypothetical protein ACMXX9_03585 [Candidatus Woesearchaeota archaeon]
MANLKLLINAFEIYSDAYNNKDDLGSYLLKNHKNIVDKLNKDISVRDIDIKKVLTSTFIKDNFSDFYDFSMKYLGGGL